MIQQKVTTLKGMSDKITTRRRDGNTTRLLDNAISIIFNGHICVVLDHHENGKSKKANKDLFNAILRRLEFEHGWHCGEGALITNNENLEISLGTQQL